MEETKQDLTKVYNEMIALWMGVKNVWVHPKFGVYEAEDETGYIDWVDVGIKSLDYHRDWNKLMPVVQKIEKLYHEEFPKDFIQKLLAKEPTIDHHYMDVIAAPLATPINEVYESVVAFIKWYSNQPQKAS